MRQNHLAVMFALLMLLQCKTIVAAPYNWGTTGVAASGEIKNIVELTDNIEADSLNPIYTFATNPWSSDGKWIVYSAKTQGASGPWGVCKIRSDGSNRQCLTEGFLSPTDTGAQGPCFAPDNFIYFTRYTATTPEIWRMHSDGSGKVNLTVSNSRTNEEHPVVSPDGNSYAYTSGGELWVTERDGTAPVKLSGTISLGVSQYTWSPDSNWLVYRGVEGANEWLYKAKRDGTVNEVLSKPSIILGTQTHSYPAWSPDGSKVAYIWQSDNGTNKFYNIRVIAMDGSFSETSLDSASTSTSPGWITLNGPVTWSPDSTMVAYSKYYSDSVPFEALMIADADAVDPPVQLTTGYLDGRPFWSPGGNQIVFQDDG